MVTRLKNEKEANDSFCVLKEIIFRKIREPYEGGEVEGYRSLTFVEGV